MTAKAKSHHLDPQFRAKLSNPKNRARDMGKLSEVESLRVVVSRGENIEVAVEARLFFNERGNGMNPVRCNVYAYAPGQGSYRSANGSAGGCGYHKYSAALADALENAGFSFEMRSAVRLENSAAHVTADNPCGVNYSPYSKWRPWHFGGTGDRAMRDALLAAARAMGWRGKLQIL